MAQPLDTDKPRAAALDWNAIVAHQLKTPLAALNARLAGAEAVDTRPLRSDIARLSRLIDQIQLLGRARAVPDDERTRMPLTDLPRAVCAELAPLAAQKEQIISLRDLSAKAVCTVHPDLVINAFQNVIENALKYAPARSHVDVVVLASGATLVMDRGPGLHPDEWARLQKPFTRGTAAEGAKGSGLGLFVAHDVLRGHGGGLFHLTRRGGGSVVGLHLPVLRREA
ncbi:sensor histidine kinase [Roseobacter weihaiensis]|uniref:sensor histidine kinase n=1 Tax=Roseobacter weihaiensis TaxID=2763262 RepID=UPI001D09F337|nr:HAMP domain-containing sensor histidine kinase [Roseobacter sp. H9]